MREEDLTESERAAVKADQRLFLENQLEATQKEVRAQNMAYYRSMIEIYRSEMASNAGKEAPFLQKGRIAKLKLDILLHQVPELDLFAPSEHLSEHCS